MVTLGVMGGVADNKTEMGLLRDLMKQEIHPNDMMNPDPGLLGYCIKSIPVAYNTAYNKPVPHSPKPCRQGQLVWKALPRGNGRLLGLRKLENAKCMEGIAIHISANGKIGQTGIC